MIQVACGANAAYMPHAAAMLHSLLTQPNAQPVCVHFMHEAALPDNDLAQLEAMVHVLGGHWRAHCIAPEQLEPFPHNSRFGREAWFRTLLPELLPELERVLYLDVDTIVLRPLDALWNTVIEPPSVIAAVRNPLYPFMDPGFLSGLGLDSDREYFNSGVLLLHLTRWRQTGVTQDLQAFIRDHIETQNWPDQNAQNAVLRGRWQAVSPIWNAQNVYFDLKPRQLGLPAAQVAEVRNAPGIVHHIAPYKPWQYLCKHPYRQDYFRHLAATPWRGKVPIEDKTPANMLLRLLPQPFMWMLMLVHMPRLVQRLRGTVKR